jgi:AcrR family transcriptional regulator
MKRERRKELLGVMIEELVREGYAGISVERAQQAAGISPEEFAEEFGDKDGCLYAAYEDLADGLLRRATEGCDAGQPWPERVRAGLARLLEELAAKPLLAQAVTRSFPGIRPSAYERYVALLSRFEPLMEEGRRYSEFAEELPSEVELLAVGAAESIIFGEVDAGRAEELPAMLPEILFSVLVPFIGPERAEEEMRSAAALR